MPIIREVKKINKTGIIIVKKRNINFSSLIFILSLNFLKRKKDIKRNGVNIPACLIIKIKGLTKWLKKFYSAPVLDRA